MEGEVVVKVSEAITALDKATCADDVVLSLHSLALLFFPVDTSALSGVISGLHKDRLERAEVSSDNARKARWKVFYQGTGFPSFARVLLYDVASNWMSCISHTARKIVYDVFFTHGPPTEVVQTMVPCLEHKGGAVHDAKAVRSNAERLLELCLLENRGVLHMAREFNSTEERGIFSQLSKVAQLVASIPDKARSETPKSLSAHLFFKHITFQLLAAAEERNIELCDMCLDSFHSNMDYTFQFVGEMFTRICRRGSIDMVISVVIPQVLKRVRKFLSSNLKPVREDTFKGEPSLKFWFLMLEVISDQYAVERMTEQILHQLSAEDVTDNEASWILWMFFQRSFERQNSFRLLFGERFLLWKIFPLRILRWILQFSVAKCPPDDGSYPVTGKHSDLLDVVQRLAVVWSKPEFVQSSSMEQQIYITAALGLLLEKMTREDLDSTKELTHLVLEGVSCRLGNPSDLVRRMASSIALVFSKVIDPQNPLYLDDSCSDGNIDWEFGSASSKKGISTSNSTSLDSLDTDPSTSQVPKSEFEDSNNDESSKVNPRSRNLSRFKLVDPDEVVDPATLDEETISDAGEDGNESDDSEASSLQPYDLADDDADLKGNITQLVDVVGALRKTGDPDGVESALSVVESLIRASPDELRHIAGDLTRTLVQVRCSDMAVEGEEEPAEEKRQKALISLLVTCPFESLNATHKLLYSPHVDLSQRIMILDVMTSAAEELACTKTIRKNHQSRPLIATTYEVQPWFLPSSKGVLGAGPWEEIADTETPLNWSHRYVRTLPSKQGQISKEKTRRWSTRAANLHSNETDWSMNKFPLYAAAFMLPAMEGFDKKRHGVDLLGRDFIVLGKLIHMLGVCMKCAALHPEASALASPLLEMLSTREVCHHKEPFVRKSALFAASCTLMALHPSYVASALTEGNQEVLRGLEWVRTWALEITESDTDKDCYTMAMACLQLHAEMSLQASRALESVEVTSKPRRSIELPSNLLKGVGVIKIPSSSSPLIS